MDIYQRWNWGPGGVSIPYRPLIAVVRPVSGKRNDKMTFESDSPDDFRASGNRVYVSINNCRDKSNNKGHISSPADYEYKYRASHYRNNGYPG
jgi:hypothetical protein